MERNKLYRVEVSAKTIIFTVFFILLLFLFWVVRDLLFSLFIAFIIMSAVKPPVAYFEKKGIPRKLTTFLVFVFLFVFFGFLLSWIIPPLSQEVSLFVKYAPLMFRHINSPILSLLNLQSLTQYIPGVTNQALTIIKSIVSNAMFLVGTVFFSFYFTAEKDVVEKIVIRFFNETKTRRVVTLFDRIEKRMSAWLWGELLLMTVIGCMTFVGLNLIGVRYALPLAIIAGLLEVIPNLGPVLSTIPAFFIAITQSYFLGFSTIALYFIVQQLENNLIVPYIMRKAVGINPIVTLIALIVGGRVGGILGILLAIPLTLFFESIVSEVANNN
ncbi:hypothetical protein COY87_00475 [Candidatus Roizmanbacteria bacterium CG_4_10_14_0_8_um_filter_33_9]|uniref:AI-2E family transporter n=1 Tax=Candidatus Roizmanbacteria bacterium CG_4_10_14_0_8_um_filter_33_9 TaxID=1974826 RepID=A0A2M7QKK8_9BACT|nr:MAG: hypothetical protein COY87_00475 [Candidatus Roizmanbacteria bacterium CG_4_10_14_0_8_um_filter_33_9]